MVPYFNPVPIEIAAGFGLARGFNLANLFGLTKGKAIGVGTNIMPPPFVPLTNGPKINHFSQFRRPSMVTGYVAVRRSRKWKHRYQMCRHVGRNVPFRRTSQACP